MFTHLVMLKKEPWFIYCADESDALDICDKFQGEFSGIVVAEDLIVKQPRFKRTLEQEEIFQVEYKQPKDGEPTPEEPSAQEQMDMIDIAKEISNEHTQEL